MSRTDESEFAQAIEGYLKSIPLKAATMQELVRVIPNLMNLTAEDMEKSPSRPYECKYEQSIRNIESHKGSPGNYIYIGRLKHCYISGGKVVAAGEKNEAGYCLPEALR